MLYQNDIRELRSDERYVTLGAAIDATIGLDIIADYPEYAEEERGRELDTYRSYVDDRAGRDTRLIVTRRGQLMGYHRLSGRTISVTSLITPE